MHAKPQTPQLLQEAVALHRAGKLAEAESGYKTVLAAEPKHSHALSMLATIHIQRGDYPKGAELLQASLEYDPKQPLAHNNLASALWQLGKRDEALTHYKQATLLKPDYADAFNSRGLLLYEMRRFDEALASYAQAVALEPDYADAMNNLGNACTELRRLDDALANYRKALAIEPKNGRIMSNIGFTLHKLKRYEEALEYYRQATVLDPGNAQIHINIANTLQHMLRYDEAVAAYEKAMLIQPDTPYLTGSLLHAKQHLCDWRGSEALFEKLIREIESGKPATMPFALTSTPATAAQQRKCAESEVYRRFPPSPNPLWKGEKYTHERIRIGYFSGDFHSHAVMHLMAKFFEMHDRSRFEVTAFSFGPVVPEDKMQMRLKGAFERFIELGAKSDLEIATLARTMEIDIAIDLQGFTQSCRTGIFAQRFAPAQAMYLGYPGTMAAPYMDYLIADAVLIPKEDERHYSEKIVRIPGSYQVNDSSRNIPQKKWTRAELGLPEQGFVFCCLNNSYKITPDAFAIWMRLLERTPGSVLWLFEANPACVKNLRREAQERGIDPARLIFAPTMPLDDHIARQMHADLFLDTFHYNAHATASHALWSGLPVLTCYGSTFASRVGASLLQALGLPELVATYPAEYEKIALMLATEPGKLSAIRQKLAGNKKTQPLFDTAAFLRHMETAYFRMHTLSQAGLPPEHIF